jgi:hypothetical protein
MALSIIVVGLAATFAYYYATTESQISSLNNQVSTLKESGHSFCLTVYATVSRLSGNLSNIVQTLQGQIQSDTSLIATLNSTKPAGYEGMVATLNTQITQDLAIISANSNNLAQISSPPNTFCTSVSEP